MAGYEPGGDECAGGDDLNVRHDAELEAQLDGFARALQDGRNHKACDKLEGFESAVKRRRSAKLTHEQANDLLNKSDELQVELSCR